MGFLDQLKSSENNAIHPEWHVLSSIEEAQNAISTSNEQAVVFFKHSSRCGISVQVLHQIKDAWEYTDDQIKFFYLDLLNYRPISNFIAEETQVMHQSPQLIMLKDGAVVYHASHFNIKVDQLDSLI